MYFEKTNYPADARRKPVGDLHGPLVAQNRARDHPHPACVVRVVRVTSSLSSSPSTTFRPLCFLGRRRDNKNTSAHMSVDRPSLVPLRRDARSRQPFSADRVTTRRYASVPERFVPRRLFGDSTACPVDVSPDLRAYRLNNETGPRNFFHSPTLFRTGKVTRLRTRGVTKNTTSVHVRSATKHRGHR